MGPPDAGRAEEDDILGALDEAGELADLLAVDRGLTVEVELMFSQSSWNRSAHVAGVRMSMNSSSSKSLPVYSPLVRSASVIGWPVLMLVGLAASTSV
jgi:hypothetical protein